MSLNSITLAETTNPDTILKAEEPSPFAGVLVSPDTYRLMTARGLEYQDFKNHLNKYTHCELGDGYTIEFVIVALMSGVALGVFFR